MPRVYRTEADETDWSTVFDEGYPVRGATDETLAGLADEVSKPLSEVEIGRVEASQRNPFPKIDPLHAAYRPFDPRAWTLPNRPLPASWLSLLRWSDGGEFRTGEHWFQFFPATAPGQGVRAMMLGYELPQYMPAALPFAFDGGGVFHLFDMRCPARGGEYPVVCAAAGSLG